MSARRPSRRWSTGSRPPNGGRRSPRDRGHTLERSGPGRDRAVLGVGAQRNLSGRSTAMGGRRRDVHRRHRPIRAAEALAPQRRTLAARVCRVGARPPHGRRGGRRRHCSFWLEQWWDEASPHVHLPAGEVAAYRSALVDRFTNPRIRHRLEQIAADGTQKLPARILPSSTASEPPAACPPVRPAYSAPG